MIAAGGRARALASALGAVPLVLLVLLVLLAVSASPASAQQRPPADTARRAPGDTIRRTAADSARARADSIKPLVDWAEDDSVMRSLRRRAGYTVVQFQAERVSFDNASRVMSLNGADSARAAVQRDTTLLVARTIQYNDSTKLVNALGDTIVMRDPSQRGDVIGLGEFQYDIARREGKTRQFSTVANAGEDWRVAAHQAAFDSDSTGERNTIYGRDGIITSCLDSVPHYHFQARELKRVSNNVIVARPAILYVQGVPVMWLPFIFQDIREGRRSGILTPRIGFSELVRNSPSYRRTAENLGYYFALTDYVDAQVSLDWRSSARATVEDPGWTALNAEIRYRWLNRFLGGSLALQQRSLSSGLKNTSVSWAHNQEFSSRTRFTSNINYVSSTVVHRRTAINPLAAIAAIGSQLNLVRQQGPLAINIGGSRKQYPGREQVDQNFPSVNVTSKPLGIGEWFVTNPSLSFTTAQQLNLDGTGDFAFRYTPVAGGLDSTRLKRNTRSTSLTLGTPFKIFDFQVQSGFRFNENENDFPEIRTIRDPADPTRKIERVYAKTFLSSADFDVSIGLPQFLQGTFNLAPSVSLANVEGSGYLVRSERTAGEWVSQNKRVSYALATSPTVFRLYPGIGNIERIRHALSPSLSWSYSPTAEVSEEFLNALGKSKADGYLGSLAQNRLSFGLATNIEARMGSRRDTTSTALGDGEKVRLASIQFTPLVYDFERKRQTGGTGFATERWGYTFRSDLLPGFDLGVDYSLFQGNPVSDTAKFSPYRESVRATFSLTENSTIVRSIGRLFGYRSSSATGRPDVRAGALPGDGTEDAFGAPQAMGATTGTRAREGISEIPSGQGFQAAFTVSSQRQRPPVGGRVVDFDPAVQCAGLIGLPQYETCVFNAEQTASNQVGQNPTTEGGTFFRVRPTTSVGLRTSFNLTPKWAAAWNTMYDVEESEFAMQVVTLQRELHDWRAIFGFSQGPNGNFAFTFFISLKAQPEIKLDYDRQTYRPPLGTPPP